MHSDDGILYIATGEKYLQEAKRAATRASKITDLPISIVTYRPIESDLFDQVIIDQEPEDTFSDKPRNLLKSPYDRTVYMDTDTYVIEPINDLFDILDKYHIAVTLDPFEGGLYSMDQTSISKGAVPEFQTGVIVYQSTPEAEQFIDSWNYYHSPPEQEDQLSFRSAYEECNTEVGVFSPRYNALVRTSIGGPVKILHNPQRSLADTDLEVRDEILDEINAGNGIRLLSVSHADGMIYDPFESPVGLGLHRIILENGYLSIPRQLIKKIKLKINNI